MSSDKKKKDADDFDPKYDGKTDTGWPPADRGGKKDGSSPNYEERQSSPIESDDFDHEDTKW